MVDCNNPTYCVEMSTNPISCKLDEGMGGAAPRLYKARLPQNTVLKPTTSTAPRRQALDLFLDCAEVSAGHQIDRSQISIVCSGEAPVAGKFTGPCCAISGTASWLAPR